MEPGNETTEPNKHKNSVKLKTSYQTKWLKKRLKSKENVDKTHIKPGGGEKTIRILLLFDFTVVLTNLTSGATESILRKHQMQQLKRRGPAIYLGSKMCLHLNYLPPSEILKKATTFCTAFYVTT